MYFYYAVNVFKTVATPSEQPNPSQKVSKKSKVHIILKILWFAYIAVISQLIILNSG